VPISLAVMAALIYVTWMPSVHEQQQQQQQDRHHSNDLTYSSVPDHLPSSQSHSNTSYHSNRSGGSNATHVSHAGHNGYQGHNGHDYPSPQQHRPPYRHRNGSNSSNDDMRRYHEQRHYSTGGTDSNALTPSASVSAINHAYAHHGHGNVTAGGSKGNGGNDRLVDDSLQSSLSFAQ
jgi:hypothetical protein